MTVRKKIFIKFSILCVCSLLLTVFLSQRLVREKYRDSVIQSYKRETVYIANRLQTRMEHVKDYQRTIALDVFVTDTFKNHPGTLKSESDIYSMNRFLRKRVTAIIGTNQEIYQYVFATLDGTFLYFSDEKTVQSSVGSILGDDFFHKENVGRGFVWNGPYEMTRTDGSQFRFFVLSKQIVDILTLEPLGYVAFILDESFFSDIFEENMPFEMQTDFYLLDKEANICSASAKDTIGDNFYDGAYLLQEDLEQLTKNGMCEVRNDDGVFLYTMTKTKNSEWSVVHVTDMNMLLHSQNVVMTFSLLIGFAVCVITLCITRFIADKYTVPIVELSHKMDNYYATQAEESMETQVSGDEIQHLYLSFERMVTKSEQLMDQIYLEQEEKRNYQLQLIQSQIKPHFLYNTLEMIKSLVDCNMQEEASKAIMAVSRFYRLSLNSGNEITTIGQEIELSHQYLYIQRLRYAEYMDYSIADCREIKNYAIPKLTLQPLLENAIYHGIKEKQKFGRIILSVQKENDKLTFIVWDNGKGMTEQELQDVRESLNNPEKKEESSFGLYSINRRLQLFYGKECSLKIESEAGEYTKVTFVIPTIEITDSRKNILRTDK